MKLNKIQTIKKYLKYIILWIQKNVNKSNHIGVIVGLSGGIDSSVVALLAKKAFPCNYLIATLPCESFNQDEKYANLLIKKHNLKNIKINLTSTYNNLIKKLLIKKKIFYLI